MKLLRQWRIAVMFYSRIPVGLIDNYQPEDLKMASRWLPLVGFILAVMLSAVWVGLASLWPASISLVLLFIVSVVLTGAFHEDGWADTWDGLGGGWKIQQKLAIMKDSRLGTYGGLSLMLLVLLKYQLWLVLSSQQFLLSLLASMVLSRFVPLALISQMTYVRDEDQSKAKPVADGLGASSFFVIALQFLLISGLLLWLGMDLQLLVLIVVALILVAVIWGVFSNWQIGGYTGDTLGASQQLSELAVLLMLVGYMV